MALASAHEIYEDEDFKKRTQVALLEYEPDTTVFDYWYSLYGLLVASNSKIVNAWETSKNLYPYHSRRGHDPHIIKDETIKEAVVELVIHIGIPRGENTQKGANIKCNK